MFGKNKAEHKAAMPMVTTDAPTLPTNVHVQTIFIGGIFFLMLMTALKVAAVIAIPFVLALVLKLVFNPVSRHLSRLHIPRALASMVVILALLGSVVGFGAILSEPAAEWGAKLPSALPKLQQRLSFVTDPMKDTEQMLAQADSMANGTGHKEHVVTMQGSNLSDRIVAETQAVIGGMFTTLLILLFMLSAGDTFLRRFVEILPRFQDKRQAVDISHEIERDISRYLLTITAMNICVGTAAGLAMLVCGVEDPILWGFLAFLLNYIPIIGPFSGIVVFFLVGTMSLDTWMAYVPAGMYVMIHFIEGTLVTPMLLARRFTINPVLVITSLIFWYWMWGIPGAILAMPMLAIMKLVCDRIERLAPFGHFLEG